jgi:hypothetical protein
MVYVVLTCRGVLALVFVISSVSKLRGTAFRAFVSSLRRLPVVPDRWARLVAVVVVATEVAIPLLLAMQAMALAGFALAASLLTAFAVGIAVSVRKGAPVSCRCFGPSDTPLGARHVVRNTILIAVAVTGSLAMVAGGPPDLHPALTVIALTAAACVAALIVRFDDLVELFAGPPSLQRVGKEYR